MVNNLAKYFDHTLLKFDASLDQIKALCDEAKTANLFAVCVPPYFVVDAKEFLKGTTVKVATVVGFPMGYSKTLVKMQETRLAIQDGADEIDMVANIAALRSGNWEEVEQDILALNEICHDHGKVLKVIIESSELQEEEIVKLCEIANRIKVDFMKTSTGFNGTGAQEKDVELMRKVLNNDIHIKASGGIRDLATMETMIKAGADRIGASSSMKILAE